MKKRTIQGRLVVVPLNKLHISPLNARSKDTSDVTELAALLESQGQLQNLIVVDEDGGHGVVGGGRRYRGFKLLEQQGKLPADHPVFCLHTDVENALKASVAENTGRAPMHPADEFYAFKVLVEDGTPVEDIAAQFGCTPLVVQRRLLLAKVAPELVEIYRRGGMNLETLQAFTLTDDQKLQCKVWYGAPQYFRHARSIRDALTKGKIDTSNNRVSRFVGLDAYEAAGGDVLRDLFGTPDAGYVTDMSLMQKLAKAKLDAAEEKLRAEGWSFVEVCAELGYSDVQKYTRTKPKTRQLTDEEKAEISALEEAANAANEAMRADSKDDLTDGEIAELERKGEKAVDRIAAINDSLETFSDRQKKTSGVVLGINAQGSLEVHRGMIDPKVAAAKEKAKAKADKQKRIDAGEPVEVEEPSFSESLLRKLSANRSAAMSAHLLEAPRVALDLLCSTLLSKVIYNGHYGSGGLAIVPTLQLSALSSSADDMEQSKAWGVLTNRRSELQDELPGNPAELFDWVSTKSITEVVNLLAFCTAACINTTSSHDHARQLESVEQIIGLDMADWWQPTRKTFLSQVPKPVIVAALKDVGIGELAIKQADKLKKGELAQKAEELLADTGWLPALLCAKTPAAKKTAKRKVAAKAAAPTPAKTAAGKKPVPARKAAAKPAPAKKFAVKKVAAKKIAVKKAAAKVPPVSKPTAKTVAAVHRVEAKPKRASALDDRAIPADAATPKLKPGLNPAAAWPFPTERP